MTPPSVTAHCFPHESERNETKWSDEAVSPFPIEEVKIPSSKLHPAPPITLSRLCEGVSSHIVCHCEPSLRRGLLLKREIASSAKVMPPRNDK